MEGREKGTEGSIQELIRRHAGGSSEHTPDVQRHQRVNWVLGSEQGWLSTLAGPTAPSRGRACSEQMVVSGRSLEPTQFLGPFCPFPPARLSCFSPASCPPPPHPYSLFFLHLLFLVQCFPQGHLQGFGQNDYSVGVS